MGLRLRPPSAQGASRSGGYSQVTDASMIIASFNFTSCVGLQEEEPQAAHIMSFTGVSHTAASVFTEC